METVLFGKTAQKVTRVGLGGEGVLRTYGLKAQASEIIHTAISQGITYFDSARVYSDSEVYYGSVWGKDPLARSKIFQTSKSASRNREGALKDLQETFERLQTNYLDLWQIHDVRTEEDLRQIAGSGGSLEAFLEAKASGKVRLIGVTGHHDPHILTRAVEEWPVDAVMMPVNPIEELLGGFLTSTMPAAKEKGIAVIGMKLLGGAHYLFPHAGLTPELLIRFAFSHGISIAIVGCSTPEEVKTLAALGQEIVPLTDRERRKLVRAFEPHIKQLAFYRGVL